MDPRVAERSQLPPLHARLLGPTEIRVGDRILSSRDWPRRPARAVLVLLLGTPGHRLARDQVLESIWTDRDVDSSLNSLYKALHALRRTLEPGLSSGRSSRYIETTGETIALIPHDGMWVDVDLFMAALARIATEDKTAQRTNLQAAADLYRGDFLADDLYADWPIPRREALRTSWQRSALALAHADLEQGEPLASLGHLESLVADDPTFEEAHRAIMRAYLAAGQRGSALQQYERCRLALAQELAIDPDPETMELLGVARRVPLPDQDLAGASPAFFNVPTPPTRTIGRTVEITAVTELLVQEGVRLVSVVGTGGVGKTRLALEIAPRMTSRFPDGIAFVPLAAIRDSALLFPAIGRALHLRESSERSIAEIVTTFLGRRRFLLILDNLEHLPGIAQPIAELLAATPGLTILTTSRAPLRVRAEHLVSLDVLATPDRATGPNRLDEIASVALFLQCMHAWRGEPKDDGELVTIGELCMRLEGLPLAIELAASRTWESTPETILRQLIDRFETLRDGPRDLPDRHQTLRQTISWSYDLLSRAERALFGNLSIFPGGAELDALVAICGPDAPLIADSLVEKSLARWEIRDGQRRLLMLETIREYAAERLADGTASPRLEERHAAFFANLVRQAEPALRGRDQLLWLDRIDRDLGNLRASLDWSLASGNPEMALEIMDATGTFWFFRGSNREGLQWLQRGFAQLPAGETDGNIAARAARWGSLLAANLGEGPEVMRFNEIVIAAAQHSSDRQIAGSALMLRAARARNAGDYALARTLTEEALETAKALEDGFSTMRCQVALSYIEGRTGNATSALARLEQALSIARAAGDRLMQSYVLGHLSSAHLDAGHYEQALAAARESEELARLLDVHLWLSWALTLQGAVLSVMKDYPAAMVLHQEAYLLFTDSGDQRDRALAAGNLASTALNLGDHATARTFVEIAVSLARDHGMAEDVVTNLYNAADLALALGHPDVTVALATTAERENKALGLVLPDRLQAQYDALLHDGEAHLTSEDAARARATGAQASIADAVQRAIELC
ncbi:MAG: BTAD domain-containing putative transcriptional regulator, partial [Thermomicrobiales bacterium]